MHMQHFLVGLIAGMLAMYVIIMICNSCNVNVAGLDNRPRWMMGGLRDDTGSHNAKDVFGMGFGLDQTRKGVAAADTQFSVKLGNVNRQVGTSKQTEYSPIMGDSQVQSFLDRKSKMMPRPLSPMAQQKFLDRPQHFAASKKQMPVQARNANSPPKKGLFDRIGLGLAKKPTQSVLPMRKQSFAGALAPNTTEDFLAQQLK